MFDGTSGLSAQKTCSIRHREVEVGLNGNEIKFEGVEACQERCTCVWVSCCLRELAVARDLIQSTQSTAKHQSLTETPTSMAIGMFWPV